MRTIPIHPKGLADMRIERVGQKYQPSNGTEGMIFIDAWCSECQRDKALREGIDISECDDDELCEIVAKTMTYDINDKEYPSEWQFGSDGQPRCTAFIEAGQPIPEPRCTKTLDMFSAPEED